jgi:hypothetical protein
MAAKPRPVKTIYLLLIAILLGVFFSLLLEVFYLQAGPGYVDKGFPMAWERVWGGVTSIYDYVGLFLDIVIWSSVLFIIIFVVFKYALGWKPS